MTKTNASPAAGFSIGPFTTKLVFALLLMILAAGVVVVLGGRMTSEPGSHENQPSGSTPSGNFSISVSEGSDDHLELPTSSSPETVFQETRVIVENTTAGYNKTVTLGYISDVGENWLSVSFSQENGTPPFISTVTVSVETGRLQGYKGTFELVITGTSSDNVFHGVPIQVTIQ